ncbi:TRAP transporter substrate-binding protein DctP [Burkholderiaceae bacterium FT117]|uniref:TRAP transporter substrate-binding protein n=1 Tax=Zeimonas sediminis TaxID=2944268 RepID=UPI0023431C9D|nr:TRAP transporter substrate-binding protein DctP [Zeimonas sediminis]MCM5571560.1 TRAP transporter substrate-binding protein DctP [Zeimonas sediminis]
MTPTRRSTLRLAAGAVASFGLCASALAADFTMRISHQFPPTHHTALNLQQFEKEVEAATKGRVDVQLFGAAQLFKPNQNHPAVASGKVEAAAILSFQWGGTIPEMSVTVIPYLMTSVAKQKAFIGSEASKLLDAKMAARGVKNIAWIVDTNDGIFTSAKKPLVSPADFSGLKIRGLNRLFDAGLEAMGASPSAMPGTEVYQALQTGVLDAGFTGVKAAYSRKFYEIQKYGVASNIILAFDNLVVNPAWWNGLPADVRNAIQSAADKAVQRSIRNADGVPAEDVRVLNEKGMQTISLTKAQEQAMADAMQPAVKKEFLRATAPDGVRLLELIDRL